MQQRGRGYFRLAAAAEPNLDPPQNGGQLFELSQTLAAARTHEQRTELHDFD